MISVKVKELLVELHNMHGKMTMQEVRTRFEWARGQAEREATRTRGALEQLGVVRFFGNEVHLTKKGKLEALRHLRSLEQLDENQSFELNILEQLRYAVWVAIDEIVTRLSSFSAKLKKAPKLRRPKLVEKALVALARAGMVKRSDDGRFCLTFTA